MSDNLQLWPWDRNEDPLFINEDGYEWYLDESITKQAKDPKGDLPGLSVVCFIVKKEDFIIFACVDGEEERGVIAEAQDYKQFETELDKLRLKKQNDNHSW